MPSLAAWRISFMHLDRWSRIPCRFLSIEYFQRLSVLNTTKAWCVRMLAALTCSLYNRTTVMLLPAHISSIIESVRRQLCDHSLSRLTYPRLSNSLNVNLLFHESPCTSSESILIYKSGFFQLIKRPWLQIRDKQVSNNSERDKKMNVKKNVLNIDRSLKNLPEKYAVNQFEDCRTRTSRFR